MKGFYGHEARWVGIHGRWPEPGDLQMEAPRYRVVTICGTRGIVNNRSDDMAGDPQMVLTDALGHLAGREPVNVGYERMRSNPHRAVDHSQDLVREASVALRDCSDEPVILLIVAHGDEEGCLEIGDGIRPQSLYRLLGDRSARLAPGSIVLLVACYAQGATPDISSQFARSFLDAGAGVVIAPFGSVPSATATSVLLSTIQNVPGHSWSESLKLAQTALAGEPSHNEYVYMLMCYGDSGLGILRQTEDARRLVPESRLI